MNIPDLLNRAIEAETKIEQLRAQLAESRAYADELAAGLPEGMLPADIRNLREANAIMADELEKLNRPMPHTKFKLGDRVRKVKGSEWSGLVVGTYSTQLTPEGYAVESDVHAGSVQIYPAAALELVS